MSRSSRDTKLFLTGTLGSIVLDQENTKRKIEVTSYKLLDLLGDFGGQLEVFSIVFGFFGTIISARMFSTDVLISNFIKRVDISDSFRFKENYEKINMNICVRLFEPIYGPLLKYCNKGIRDRIKMVKVANERFENELDIHELLKKIRAVEGLMRNILSKQQLKLLKYMKNSIIETKQIDDPTSSS